MSTDSYEPVKLGKMASTNSTVSQLLRRQKTIKMKAEAETREYRIVTGGEDGILAWWNVKCPSPAQH